MYKLIGADGKEYGPISAEVVRQWIAEGRANGLTKVLPEGATEWKSLSDLPEFAPALGRMALPTTTPAPFSSVPPAHKTNGLAIAGLILGILSVTMGLCCCSGFPFSIPGAICSGIALSQIGRNPQQEGRGIAITGLILSIAGLLLGIIIVVLYGIVASVPDVIRKIQNL
jgi:Domain of unknown function (DUF4190)/GYF domain 2